MKYVYSGISRYMILCFNLNAVINILEKEKEAKKNYSMREKIHTQTDKITQQFFVADCSND